MQAPHWRAIPRAWVFFIDPSTIRDSYNVSSVSNIATGRYVVTFQTPFGYASGATGYAAITVHRAPAGAVPIASLDQVATENNAYSVNAVGINTTNSTSGVATDLCSVIVWGS